MPFAREDPPENSTSDEIANRLRSVVDRLKHLFALISGPPERTNRHVIPGHDDCAARDSTQRKFLDDFAIDQARRAPI